MIDDQTNEPEEDFASQAATRGSQTPVIVELWQYLRYSDKWWMAPIIITILGLGALVFLAGTGVAPFIYSVF